MTPKEKAEQLVEKYWSIKWQTLKTAKNYRIISMSQSAATESAIIAVDEILQVCSPFADDYWQQVKKELLNL